MQDGQIRLVLRLLADLLGRVEWPGIVDQDEEGTKNESCLEDSIIWRR